jgi:hypothetical protein
LRRGLDEIDFVIAGGATIGFAGSNNAITMTPWFGGLHPTSPSTVPLRAHEKTTGNKSARLSQFPDIATQTKTPAMLVLTGVCDGKLL